MPVHGAPGVLFGPWNLLSRQDGLVGSDERVGKYRRPRRRGPPTPSCRRRRCTGGMVSPIKRTTCTVRRGLRSGLAGTIRIGCARPRRFSRLATRGVRSAPAHARTGPTRGPGYAEVVAQPRDGVMSMRRAASRSLPPRGECPIVPDDVRHRICHQPSPSDVVQVVGTPYAAFVRSDATIAGGVPQYATSGSPCFDAVHSRHTLLPGTPCSS